MISQQVAIQLMRRTISIFLFIFQLSVFQAEAQENAVAPPRTPEQEASLQTTKMRQELGLSAGQAQEVYEINLRHARERQASTSRSEALKRVKNKEQELQRVLSPRQYNRLQEMRYDHPAATSIDASVNARTRPITNPQRVESGRVIPSREGNQPSTSTRRPINTNPSDSRNTPTYQRGREVSPATRNSDSRRSVPEGTRYIPNSSERNSPSRTSERSSSSRTVEQSTPTRTSERSSPSRTSEQSSSGRSSSSGSTRR